MTYNVFSGMLNPTQSVSPVCIASMLGRMQGSKCQNSMPEGPGMELGFLERGSEPQTHRWWRGVWVCGCQWFCCMFGTQEDISQRFYIVHFLKMLQTQLWILCFKNAPREFLYTPTIAQYGQLRTCSFSSNTITVKISIYIGTNRQETLRITSQ